MSHDFITVPPADRYRIINARLPVDLTPELEKAGDTDRFAACEILVESGRIAALNPPGGTTPAADEPTVDLRDGDCVATLSSTFTPTSTRVTSGRAVPIWPEPTLPPGPPRRRTAKQTGTPRTCASGWSSLFVARTRTARQRCAPTSIPRQAGGDFLAGIC